MPAGDRGRRLRWLVIATALSLMALISVFFIDDVEYSSAIVQIYVMLAESIAPLLTPILLALVFVRIGPQERPFKRKARAVCAIALYAIPYYFAAGVAFSGNLEVYPNDMPVYAALVATALVTAVAGFLPSSAGQSN